MGAFIEYNEGSGGAGLCPKKCLLSPVPVAAALGPSPVDGRQGLLSLWVDCGQLGATGMSAHPSPSTGLRSDWSNWVN